MLRPLEMAHQFLAEVITKEDVVVDATMGNGHDTAFLAQLAGQVYAFDIQEQALANTQEKLDKLGLQHVRLILDGHQHVDQYVETLKAAIFNLGYLPKTDKSVVTKADTTLTALDALTNQLVVGGRIAIMIYYGHEGGKEEKDAVIKWTSSLPQKDWEVTSYAPLNQIHTPPILVLIEKRK